ncbi:MAG: hypothetical protein PWQ86_1804, partial [Bacillota bacterium]|nr:hypothetical protein [Bacillota bacterium]
MANQILIGMILGALLGFAVGPRVSVIAPIGTVFLRLLKMTILPLIFFSIVAGIASVADLKRLRKVGAIFLGYWAIASLLAAATGIIWAYIIKPGIGIPMPGFEKPEVKISLLDSVIGWIPDNVAKAFSEGNFIQVIVFAIFAGITISLIAETKSGKFLVQLFEAANNFISRMVAMVLRFAPIGVFALMANVTGTVGTLALKGIGKMLITQYLAYATVIIVYYPLILKFLAKVNPLNHYRNIYPAMVMAFSTQSSSATIPVTMDCTKNRAGVPADIVNLITPPAATINMHACAAEMPIYAVFASQLYNVPLTLPNLRRFHIPGPRSIKDFGVKEEGFTPPLVEYTSRQ